MPSPPRADVPCAHTMYLDKPLAGHNLMQAIARVNRVYGEKPGGVIVDLIGLADALPELSVLSRLHVFRLDTVRSLPASIAFR